jgi:hypothetical protein
VLDHLSPSGADLLLAYLRDDAVVGVASLFVVSVLGVLFFIAVFLGRGREKLHDQPVRPSQQLSNELQHTQEAAVYSPISTPTLLPFFYNGDDDRVNIHVEQVLTEQRLRGLVSTFATTGGTSRCVKLLPKQSTSSSTTPRYHHQLKAFTCSLCEARSAEVEAPSLRKGSKSASLRRTVFSHVESDVVQRHALYCTDDYLEERQRHGGFNPAEPVHRGWWCSSGVPS